LGGVGIKKGHI